MLSSKLESLETVIALEKKRLFSSQEQLRLKQFEIKEKQLMIRLCELCLEEQSEAIKHIEDMVNALLSSLNDDLTFEFETTYKTDKVTVSGVRPTIFNNGNGNRPSGGQRTVASLGLLFAFIKLKQISQVGIFDEVGADVVPAIVQEIFELGGQILDQLILVTHQDVTLPLTYEVVKRNKISQVIKQ